MTDKRRIRLLPLLCVLVLTAPMCASAQETVSVAVAMQREGANAKYAYTVTNRAEQEIVTLLVGVNLDKGDPHLASNPVGWRFTESEQIGYGWRIPRSGATAPAGWIPLLMLFEERNEVAVSWIVKDKTVRGIARGKTLTGFEVTVPRVDRSFLKPPFTAIFADGTQYSGTVTSE